MRPLLFAIMRGMTYFLPHHTAFLLHARPVKPLSRYRGMAISCRREAGRGPAIFAAFWRRGAAMVITEGKHGHILEMPRHAATARRADELAK